MDGVYVAKQIAKAKQQLPPPGRSVCANWSTYGERMNTRHVPSLLESELGIFTQRGEDYIAAMELELEELTYNRRSKREANEEVQQLKRALRVSQDTLECLQKMLADQTVQTSLRGKDVSRLKRRLRELQNSGIGKQQV